MYHAHFYQCSNSEGLLQMYVSLDHHRAEYANQVWNTYKTAEINFLEDVQKIKKCVCLFSTWHS